MLNPSFPRTRVAITAATLIFGIVLRETATRVERVPLRRSFQHFPATLGEWQGQDQPLESRIVRAAGVDDYLQRRYAMAADDPLDLYVGYYRSQRTGDTIHSPRNCLPGSGWEPIHAGRLAISLAPGPELVVNEYIVQKGLEKDLVLYWYQARGRVVASEYAAKFWMVVDAVRRNRTDGALVRIWTPISGAEETARARAIEFVRLLYPHLIEFVPN